MLTHAKPASWLDPEIIAALTGGDLPAVTNVVYVREGKLDGPDAVNGFRFRFRLGEQTCFVRATGLDAYDANKREAWLWIALRSLAHKLVPVIQQICEFGETDVTVVPTAEYVLLKQEHAAFERILKAQRTVA